MFGTTYKVITGFAWNFHQRRILEYENMIIRNYVDNPKYDPD